MEPIDPLNSERSKKRRVAPIGPEDGYLLGAGLWKPLPKKDAYPYNLPAVRALAKLLFAPRLTIIIGENGSGKSTLIEAIAVAAGFNAEGGSKNFNFKTEDSHSDLHDYLRLSRNPFGREEDGFFLRAESFYNVASEVERLGADLRNSYGGKSLHEQSHGESFLSLLVHRFYGPGLYFLDEPEAALSPTRQLSLLSILHTHVTEFRSQFIMATHSPILMGYPGARLLELTEDGINEVQYEDTDHYRVTLGFLTRREKMLRELGIE